MYRFTTSVLTRFSLKNVSKKKLLLLTNTIILISTLAVTASFISLYYEKKIVDLNRELSTELGNEVIYNHWLSEIPKNVKNIENILDQISKENNFLLYLNNLNKKLITSRDLAHNPITNLVRFNKLNLDFLRSCLNDAILISKNEDEILKVNEYKSIFEKIQYDYITLTRKNDLNLIANNPGKIDTYSQKEKEIFYNNSLVYIDDLIDSLKNIKLLNIKSILKYYSQSKSQSLQKINSLKLEIKEISKKESQTILFAFLIQILIFFIIQFFEFGFDFSTLTKKRGKS